MNDIKVSVCCFTYNHAPYLSKALDSVLSQKTNFRYEIIIGDDCSTDGSQDIINAYAIKFPDLIKTIYQPVNSRGKKTFQTYTNRQKASMSSPWKRMIIGLIRTNYKFKSII